MSHKAILLQSVSAVATAAVATAAGSVQAAGTPAATSASQPAGYTYSIQGGFLLSPAETDADLLALESDKGGSGTAFFDPVGGQTQTGFNGAVTLDKHIDNTWDFGWGASINSVMGSRGTLNETGSSFHSAGTGFTSSSFSGTWSSTSKFDFETMDFEVGFSPKLDDNLSVRLFAGIRTLHFNNSTSRDFIGTGHGSGFVSGVTYADTFSFHFGSGVSSDFFGAGPRIGVAGSTRFSGSRFGLSGMAAGAVIFGQQTDTHTVSISGVNNISRSGGPVSSSSYHDGVTHSESATKTVLDLQGQAGIDYYLDDTSKLTVGYQGEWLGNVGPIGTSEGEYVNGGFLKLTGNF